MKINPYPILLVTGALMCATVIVADGTTDLKLASAALHKITLAATDTSASSDALANR